MALEMQNTSEGRHSVTAFFEDRDTAQKARADLLAAGYPEQDVTFVSGAEAASAASAPVRDQSIIKSLLEIFVFMPPHDQLTYAEGVRRGGIALMVRTGPDGYERAIDILDRDGAVDLDEREASWRNQGWTARGDATRPGGPGSPDQAGFERSNRHDPLVNPDANKDFRERIGVGTSDMTVGTDIDPPSAATEPSRIGESRNETAVRRDTAHGRSRVRSYIAGETKMPQGIDPQI